jgi:Ran GTPase-activating protein (RanGAP) involved in mRNA processing and transport
MHSLCSNAFAVALETVPAEDWCRTWPADRTIMLSKTSKKIKNIIVNMCLPVDVRISFTFWNKSTIENKLDFIMKRLKIMTSLNNITTLVLKCCNIQIILNQFIKVLEHCPMLKKLNLKRNNINAEGAAMIVKALKQCHNIELTYLDLSINKIGDTGTARVAKLLRQCPKLTHLDLSLNKISDKGIKRLTSVISKCHNLALIDFYLTHNLIQADGIESIVKVLTQCPNIKNLNLSWNVIGFVEAECIARNYNVDLSSLYQMRTVSYP